MVGGAGKTFQEISVTDFNQEFVIPVTVKGIKDPAAPLIKATQERQTDPHQGLAGEEEPQNGQADNNQQN
jgi:hypothetical protein